jgi:GDPmannose 4,6-dehydratase
MKKRALIIGISGQVGSIMAEFLLKKKYIVIGVSRKKNSLDLSSLVKLKINHDVKVVSLDVENYKDLLMLINNIKPHEIYQFSGVSSIRRAQIQPLKTLKYILNITYNLLQICKKKKKN